MSAQPRQRTIRWSPFKGPLRVPGGRTSGRFVPLLLAVSCLGAMASAEQPSGPTDVLIIVGPSDHPPGSHEVAAGGRLMAHCLQQATNLDRVTANVSYGWPRDPQRLEAADTVVFIGDTFPPQRLPETASILQQLEQMMNRGCGIVCVHYATGLRAEDVAADGEHPLLHWMGGYFATRGDHHQSVARIYQAATITPAAPEHPTSRGWQAFTLHDEPYINNYFGPQDNRPAPGVTPLATSMLPPEAPQREIVAWSIQRPDGGRGFGIVMPHFYRNWKIDPLRTLILNGIVWTAQHEVPQEGVQSPTPDLTTFGPASIDPQPRRPKPQ